MTSESSNLMLRRSAQSVWDRQDYEHSRARALGILGLAMIAAGTVLVACGYTSKLNALRSRVRPPFPRRPRQDDQINSAAEESFPASDPPGWTPSVGNPAHT